MVRDLGVLHSMPLARQGFPCAPDCNRPESKSRIQQPGLVVQGLGFGEFSKLGSLLGSLYRGAALGWGGLGV